MSLSLLRLSAEWAEAIRALRHYSLVESPHVFLRGIEEERDLPASYYSSWCENGIVAGLLTPASELIGMAVLKPLAGLRVSHRAFIGPVYVMPEHRGQGHSRTLMRYLLDAAEPPVSQLHLGVGLNNPAAIKLYESLGFESYGTDPGAIFYNGAYIDDALMVKYVTQKEERK